jgi:hypothetical protein
MQITKQMLSFGLLSVIYTGLMVGSQPNQVNASLTYQTDFSSGNWLNNLNNTSPLSTTRSPFKVTTNGHTFIISYGSLDAGVAYSGSKNNASPDAYFEFNPFNSPSRIILDPFESLGNHTYQKVIAMATSFYYVEIEQISLSWTNSGNHDFEVKPIYSINEGVSWQDISTISTVTFTTGIPDSISTTTSLAYNQIRLGYYFGTNTLVSSNYYIGNPTVSVTYQGFTDSDAANALNNEVSQYTPCTSDDRGLILLTSAKRTELINKYNALSNEAKTIFASLPVDVYYTYTALDRYLFLMSKIIV